MLVSLSLWNEMQGRFIHCSPVAGLSGWIYIRFGISGSALPAITHRLREEEKESMSDPSNHMLSYVAASRPPPHSPIVKLVSVVICGDDVEEQDVFRLLVQAGHLKLEVWKHLAARGEKERDHH